MKSDDGDSICENDSEMCGNLVEGKNQFGTWFLIDVVNSDVANTFHWSDNARRKRDDLIEYWDQHTEDNLVIDGIAIAYEKTACDIYERINTDGE